MGTNWYNVVEDVGGERITEKAGMKGKGGGVVGLKRSPSIEKINITLSILSWTVLIWAIRSFVTLCPNECGLCFGRKDMRRWTCNPLIIYFKKPLDYLGCAKTFKLRKI